MKETGTIVIKKIFKQEPADFEKWLGDKGEYLTLNGIGKFKSYNSFIKYTNNISSHIIYCRIFSLD